MKFVINDKYNVPKIQQLKMIRLLLMGFLHRFCKPTQSTIAFLLMTLITTNVYGHPKFKITLLGTGTPAPSIERFGSSTLIEAGSETLLFDVGRGTTQRLWQLGIPLRQVTDVFLTHFHSDHTVGLPDLWLTGWLPAAFGQRVKPLHIWGGHGVKRLTKNLQKAYQTDIKMRIVDEKLSLPGVSLVGKEIHEGVVYERNGVKVTAFNVDHGKAIRPALGYRIDYNGHTVVISGDTRVCDNLLHFAKGADVLIHEVAAAKVELLNTSKFFRRVIAHHTTPEEAGMIFESVKPKLAVYSHLVLLGSPTISTPTIAEVVALTRKNYSGQLEIGEDLMTLEISDTISVRRFAAITD